MRGILGLQPLLCQPRLGQQGSDQLLPPSSSVPSNVGVGLGAFSTGGDRGSPYSCTSGHTTHTRRLGGHSVSCCRAHLRVFWAESCAVHLNGRILKRYLVKERQTTQVTKQACKRLQEKGAYLCFPGWGRPLPPPCIPSPRHTRCSPRTRSHARSRRKLPPPPWRTAAAAAPCSGMLAVLCLHLTCTPLCLPPPTSPEAVAVLLLHPRQQPVPLSADVLVEVQEVAASLVLRGFDLSASRLGACQACCPLSWGRLRRSDKDLALGAVLPRQGRS